MNIAIIGCFDLISKLTSKKKEDFRIELKINDENIVKITCIPSLDEYKNMFHDISQYQSDISKVIAASDLMMVILDAGSFHLRQGYIRSLKNKEKAMHFCFTNYEKYLSSWVYRLEDPSITNNCIKNLDHDMIKTLTYIINSKLGLQIKEFDLISIFNEVISRPNNRDNEEVEMQNIKK